MYIVTGKLTLQNLLRSNFTPSDGHASVLIRELDMLLFRNVKCFVFL